MENLPIDKDLLIRSLKNLQSISRQGSQESEDKIRYCYKILELIISSEDSWKSHCPISYRIYKEELENIFKELTASSDIHYDRLVFILSIFLKEASLTIERIGEKISEDMRHLLNDLQNNLVHIENSILFNHILYEFPTKVINYYISDLEFQKKYKSLQKESFEKFDEIIKTSEKHLNEIKEKQKIVEILKVALDKQVEGYNFVGLSKGFKNLLNDKEKRKIEVFKFLILMGTLTLSPLIYQVWSIFQDQNYKFVWENAIPVVGLELIMIYFFRVVLSHYHSIQTQIMQLELRQSLCQFIQSYVEYAKKMRKNGDDSSKDTLDKFENLIFSSILSNPDKVPGTFDGIEGLASFLKELKK
ncbi:MAG: hypothetical protein Q4A06_08540 [Cardiobacteriaceae bacterium]|nr:hypothetical protein [Cardiobacteriaceae bacterium]